MKVNEVVISRIFVPVHVFVCCVDLIKGLRKDLRKEEMYVKIKSESECEESRGLFRSMWAVKSNQSV